MKRVSGLYDRISDLDNLYLAYYKAKRGKWQKIDFKEFAKALDHNVNVLRHGLLNQNLQLGNYHYFTIYDPKKRRICAAKHLAKINCIFIFI